MSTKPSFAPKRKIMVSQRLGGYRRSQGDMMSFLFVSGFRVRTGDYALRF